jgi:CrcB protein
MVLYLIVFIGAGIGGALRHGMNGLALRLAGPDFPYGTMAINIVGSLAMGLIAGFFTFRGGEGLFGQMSQHWRLFLTTGVLGGFTTFSAFSLDFATLWERGAMGGAALYLAASVAGSLMAVFAALAVAKSVWG